MSGIPISLLPPQDNPPTPTLTTHVPLPPPAWLCSALLSALLVPPDPPCRPPPRYHAPPRARPTPTIGRVGLGARLVAPDWPQLDMPALWWYGAPDTMAARDWASPAHHGLALSIVLSSWGPRNQTRPDLPDSTLAWPRLVLGPRAATVPTEFGLAAPACGLPALARHVMVRGPESRTLVGSFARLQRRQAECRCTLRQPARVGDGLLGSSD